MESKRKLIYLLGCFLIVIIAFICIFSLSIGNVLDNNLVQENEIESKYSYLSKNKDDTFDLYIFASAVQWKNEEGYHLIDNNLVSSEKQGYGFENVSNSIKTYFPNFGNNKFIISENKQEIGVLVSSLSTEGEIKTYTNLYGEEKEAVHYAINDQVELYAYPINTGIHFEYVFSEGLDISQISEDISFSKAASADNRSDEYIVFKDYTGKMIIAYSPMIYSDKTKQLTCSSWNLNEKKASYILEPSDVDNYMEGKVHLEFSIQIHGEDMPDTTMYEKKNQNVYLSNKAIVGNNEILGEGIHYIRYRINYFYELDPEKILKAEYNIMNLNYQNDTPVFSMYYPVDQWSSTQMLWENKIEASDVKQNSDCVYEKNGWISFDMTEYIKEAASDYTWMTESLGSIMQCDEGYGILATSDNGEYIPYLKITLEQEPIGMYVRNTINDEIQ